MTREQKKTLEQMREGFYNYMNNISQDFANDHALSDGAYISDLFTEYADGAISIYYKDQYNYYVDHSGECENALIELYDGDSLAEMIKKDGLYNLCCKAGVCGAYLENLNMLEDDRDNIIKVLIIDYCLNTDKFLNLEQIEDIALNDCDCLFDYCDEINNIEGE